MKIGVNLITLYPGKIGGAEQYVRSVLAELATYEDMELYLFLNEQGYETFTDSAKFRLIKIKTDYDTSVQIKGYIDYLRIDVLFCPLLYLDPLDCGIPSVTTIFDIQQYYFPEYFEKELLEMRINLTRETVKKTNKIIAVSNFSKNTILENHDVESDKICVTYLDSDRSFYLPLDNDRLSELKKKLPADYILFPANMWPHKNHISLLKALLILKTDYNLDLNVVFTGTKDKEAKNISAFIQQNHLEKNITYLGYVEQDNMRYIFRLANMLVFPSLFEGFALPIVEAMRSDLPIVCANATCLPEMTAGAAVLVEPEDPKDIAKAVYAVYTDTALREKLIEAGRNICKDYSWSRCASETAEELRKLYIEPALISNFTTKDPMISIIVPVCDMRDNYAQTIASILKQSYKNFEIIAIGEIFTYRNDNEKVNYILSNAPHNKSLLINNALRIAKGEILGIAEPGDAFRSDALAIIKECFCTHRVDLLYSQTANDKHEICSFDFPIFLSNCHLNRPSYFFTKKLLDSLGAYNPAYSKYSSFDFWIRASKGGKLLFIPEVLTCLPSSFEPAVKDVLEIMNIIKSNGLEIPEGWLQTYCGVMMQDESKWSLLQNSLKFGCWKFLLSKTIHHLAPRPKPSPTPPDAAPEEMWYADGWITPRFTKPMELTGNESQLIIRGKNHFRFNNLVMEVRLNEDRYAFDCKDDIDFKLVVDLDPNHAKDEINVTLSCNQWLIPAGRSRSGDKRKLSVILESIEAV